MATPRFIKLNTYRTTLLRALEDRDYGDESSHGSPKRAIMGALARINRERRQILHRNVRQEISPRRVKILTPQQANSLLRGRR